MPRYYIERAVILCALEKLATKFVDNLPGFFFNFVFRNRMEEVAGICKTVRSQRAYSRLVRMYHKI